MPNVPDNSHPAVDAGCFFETMKVRGYGSILVLKAANFWETLPSRAGAVLASIV
jgi:hypothetical protein